MTTVTYNHNFVPPPQEFPFDSSKVDTTFIASGVFESGADVEPVYIAKILDTDKDGVMTIQFENGAIGKLTPEKDTEQ